MTNKQSDRRDGTTSYSTHAGNRPTTDSLRGSDRVVDIQPAGYYVVCPRCERELRIARKYTGEQVVCKFCRGPFQFELSDRSVKTLAFYAECAHCLQDIRAATKYAGKAVTCKFCDGQLQIQQCSNQEVFHLERVGGTLVVVPQGNSKQFRYKDIHLEVNAVQVESRKPNVDSLLIDFGDVATLGSIMIDAIVKLARNVGNALACANLRRGPGAPCHTTDSRACSPQPVPRIVDNCGLFQVRS